jgi:hypothetical protein
MKPVAELSFQEWLEKASKGVTFADFDRLRAADNFWDNLAGAVAHYLFVASKDVPDDDAALFRAAALRLMGKPVDPALMAEAGNRKSNDDPLYEYRSTPDLHDVWMYHHRVEVESAELAYDKKHSR